MHPGDITTYNKRNFNKYINAVLKASHQSVADIVARHSAYVKAAAAVEAEVLRRPSRLAVPQQTVSSPRPQPAPTSGVTPAGDRVDPSAIQEEIFGLKNEVNAKSVEVREEAYQAFLENLSADHDLEDRNIRTVGSPSHDALLQKVMNAVPSSVLYQSDPRMGEPHRPARPKPRNFLKGATGRSR